MNGMEGKEGKGSTIHRSLGGLLGDEQDGTGGRSQREPYGLKQGPRGR